MYLYCPIGKGGYIIHCYIGYTYHFYVQLHITYMYMSYIYINTYHCQLYFHLLLDGCQIHAYVCSHCFQIVHLPQTLNQTRWFVESLLTSGVVSRINHPIPWWSPRILSWSSRARVVGSTWKLPQLELESQLSNVGSGICTEILWKTLAGYGWRIFIWLKILRWLYFGSKCIGVKWYNIICFDVCFLSLLLQHVATQNDLSLDGETFIHRQEILKSCRVDPVWGCDTDNHSQRLRKKLGPSAWNWKRNN